MYNNENLILAIILPHSFLGQIMAEETNKNITVYIYDANGMPIGMQYHGENYSANTWDIYWYEKNLFGDIVAVYKHNGTKLISYTYDAWGNFTTTYHNGTTSNSLVANNPFTYRGYYYDADLGLYYLQSRYYDSNTGRFINADNMMSGVNGSLHGYNLYAYCFNNPISMSDLSGNWPKWLKKAKNWVVDKYEDWKEESFVYNVIIKNISADLGIGIGVGGEVKIGSVKVSAISRVDALGIENNGWDCTLGHHGKSSFFIGLDDFGIGKSSKTYKSFDGNDYYESKEPFAAEWSLGGEIGVGIAVHGSVSFSFSGMYDGFIEFGRKRDWWK